MITPASPSRHDTLWLTACRLTLTAAAVAVVVEAISHVAAIGRGDALAPVVLGAYLATTVADPERRAITWRWAVYAWFLVGGALTAALFVGAGLRPGPAVALAAATLAVCAAVARTLEPMTEALCDTIRPSR